MRCRERRQGKGIGESGVRNEDRGCKHVKNQVNIAQKIR